MSDSPGSRGARRWHGPIIAVVLSGFFPGLGQWYNGDRLKAVLFAVAGVATGFGPFSPLDVDINPGDPAVGLRKVVIASFPFLAVALWSVIDAYGAARRTRLDG